MENQNSIKRKLKKILKCYSEKHDINEEDSLIDDLGIDSLSFIAIITDLEKTFCIQFEEADLYVNSDLTFRNLYNTILEKMKIEV